MFDLADLDQLDASKTPCAVSRFGLVLLALVFASSIACADQPVMPRSIESLLDQLDADSYQARETAAEQLATHGEAALKPMALHSFASSPESSWRIRTVIEQIGTAGSEETFYKSTGVLRLLYPLDDAKTRQRLETLRQQWQIARKNKAIKHLRSLGATITDPYGDQLSATAAQRWQMANGARVIINGRAVNQHQVTTASTRSAKKSKTASAVIRKSLTRQELAQRVDELLESDMATNRERIFGDEGTNKPVDLGTRLQRTDPFGFGDDPFAGNVLRVNQFRLGATALFDNNFRGTVNDIKSLRQIPNIAMIHWKDRTLSTAEMRAAHELSSVQRVQFENCELPEDSVPNSAWPRFATHFEFINQTVPTWVIKRLQDSMVNSLKFSQCDASMVLHEGLRKMSSLNQLALEDTLVDENWFKTFTMIQSLTLVNLTLCKFDTDNYRDLVSRRPKLSISFTPQAFLGIRSPDQPNVNLLRARAIARQREAVQAGRKLVEPAFETRGDGGCEILDVVRDSGAERAGLKSGDVIEQINSQPITIFEDIRLIVAQHRVGDELEVQFKRDGEKRTATIKLGHFPKSAIE